MERTTKEEEKKERRHSFDVATRVYTRRRSTTVDFFHSSDAVASIMQRRPPPRKGKGLLLLAVHAVVRITERLRHRYTRGTHTTAVEKSRQARTVARGERRGEERRKRKRKKAKRGRPQREWTGNRIGVVRNIIAYTVRVSWNPARRCRSGVGERWKGWWKKYGGGERIGKQKGRARGERRGWMEACRLIVVSGPDLCMRFYDGR